MTLILYGISNCDTVKKARRWLDEQGVAYRFHDVRKDGLEPDRLQSWIDALGWEVVLTPVTYAVVGWLKRHEGVDLFDEGTDFTPFKAGI